MRVVELDEPCRRQQVNDGCFPSLAEVPRTALSLTIPFLLRVPRAVAIVPGPGQARGDRRRGARARDARPARRRCCAATRDATLFLDEASAAGLG